jgi:gamma-glutamyltranspeptidase/glutathione hydrolase
MDAVVAGVFAAAAVSPSVLFGPVAILVGGAGSGLFAIDGRVQQAGKGLPRPRGFLADEEIPKGARVGVPALVAALGAALASFGSLPLPRVLAKAIDLSRGVSKSRMALFRRIAELGPRATAEARVAEELLLVAGRGEGGLLSKRDLDEVRPRVVRAAVREVGSPFGARRVFTVPWGGDAVREEGQPVVDASRTRVVAAADARGQMAVACYEVADEGLVVEALGLVFPLVASPVLRGRTRVRPGVPCTASAPIALAEAEGLLDLAAGGAGNANAERALGAWLAMATEQGSPLAAYDEPPPGVLALARVGQGVKVLGSG